MVQKRQQSSCPVIDLPVQRLLIEGHNPFVRFLSQITSLST